MPRAAYLCLRICQTSKKTLYELTSLIPQDLKPIMRDLAHVVTVRFNGRVNFRLSDVVSLAGKVAIESAFPCIRPIWSPGRNICDPDAQHPNQGPPANVDSKAGIDKLINRYGLTAKEFAVLIIGAHAVKNAQFVDGIRDDPNYVPWHFGGRNSGVKFIKENHDLDWTPDSTARADLGMIIL